MSCPAFVTLFPSRFYVTSTQNFTTHATAPLLSRRLTVKLILILPLLSQQLPQPLSLLADDETFQSSPPFRPISRGVIGADVGEPGKGALVKPGARVRAKYVLRRSNGYFVDASYGFDRFESFGWTVGGGNVIEGFDAGVIGMREGGRRRFVVKPEVGYVEGVKKGVKGPIPPEWGARRALASHAAEPLVFEVLVVKVSEE